jgi:urea transporter
LYIAYLLATSVLFRINDFLGIDRALKEVLSAGLLPADSTPARKLFAFATMVSIVIICVAITAILHEALHIITYPRKAENATLSIVVNTIFVLIKIPKNSMLRGSWFLLPSAAEEGAG